MGDAVPLGWTPIVDVVLVAVGLFVLFSWLRRSRARFALVGIGVVGGVYLLADRLQLELTAWLLQGFFAVFVIFVVVAFQDDLRRLLEQIALLGLRSRRHRPPPGAVETLVGAAIQMARMRTGALIVIPGREPLDRWVEGGVPLDAWLTEPLLLSLFDSSSPGHDGAVIVSHNRATRFGVHLPLSNDRAQLGPGSTRHAAALGLAEHSDAFCIVVSEERGSVAIAHDGRLRTLAEPAALEAELRPFLERLSGRSGAARATWLRQRWPEAAVAAALAPILWFLLVPGSSVVQVSRPVAVQIDNLPEGYALLSVDPPEIDVTLSGSRRRMVLDSLDGLEVHIDGLLAELGRRTFQVRAENVDLPEGVDVVGVRPRKVKISVQKSLEVR